MKRRLPSRYDSIAPDAIAAFVRVRDQRIAFAVSFTVSKSGGIPGVDAGEAVMSGDMASSAPVAIVAVQHQNTTGKTRWKTLPRTPKWAVKARLGRSSDPNFP